VEREILNYKINFVESINIIHVIYSGQVSLDDRVQAVNDVCNTYLALKPLKILVNVSDLVMGLSLQEQHRFGEYLASHPGLLNAKVAVVHKPDYNPNLLIDTCAFNNGYRLAEFNQVKEAELWLAEA
jgi:hypothetical protein